MDQPAQHVKHDDLHAIYSALVAYHNNLVTIRFNTAGIYIAVLAILGHAYLYSTQWASIKLIIPIIGLIIAISVSIIESRTSSLLENIGSRGLIIEDKLELTGVGGFFQLMKSQPIQPEFPFSKLLSINTTNNKKKNYFSHSFGLKILYLLAWTLWICLLIVGIFTCS